MLRWALNVAQKLARSSPCYLTPSNEGVEQLGLGLAFFYAQVPFGVYYGS